MIFILKVNLAFLFIYKVNTCAIYWSNYVILHNHNYFCKLYLLIIRYLVTAKNIAPGEVIIREEPIAVGPMMYKKDCFCFACLRTLPKISKERQYVCSRCNFAPLCSVACEVTSWNTLHRRFSKTCLRKNLLSYEGKKHFRTILWIKLKLLRAKLFVKNIGN